MQQTSSGKLFDYSVVVLIGGMLANPQCGRFHRPYWGLHYCLRRACSRSALKMNFHCSLLIAAFDCFAVALTKNPHAVCGRMLIHTYRLLRSQYACNGIALLKCGYVIANGYKSESGNMLSTFKRRGKIVENDDDTFTIL